MAFLAAGESEHLLLPGMRHLSRAVRRDVFPQFRQDARWQRVRRVPTNPGGHAVYESLHAAAVPPVCTNRLPLKAQQHLWTMSLATDIPYCRCSSQHIPVSRAPRVDVSAASLAAPLLSPRVSARFFPPLRASRSLKGPSFHTSVHVTSASGIEKLCCLPSSNETGIPTTAPRLQEPLAWSMRSDKRSRTSSSVTRTMAVSQDHSTGTRELENRACGYSVSQFVRACAEVLNEAQLCRVAIRLVEYKNLKRQKPTSRDAAIRAIRKIIPAKDQDLIVEHLTRCIDAINPDQFHRLAKLARSRHFPADDIHESVPQSRLSDYTSAARFLTRAAYPETQKTKPNETGRRIVDQYEALCDVGDIGVAATADGLVRQVARRPPAPTRMQDKRVGEFMVHIEDPSIPAPGSTTERLVFISNIPHGPRKKIRKSIKEAFVGCGKIINLEIFDDRLRTVDERDEASLQKRGAKASSDKLRGRFSPIFAIAEFDTVEAKQRACSTYLRIFGVPCIDRLLYVEDAADKKTLVASNLPFGLAADEIARILAYALACDRSASSVPASVCRIEMTNPHIYGYKDLVVEARSDRPSPYFICPPDGAGAAQRTALCPQSPADGASVPVCVGDGSPSPSLVLSHSSSHECTDVQDIMGTTSGVDDESPRSRYSSERDVNCIQLPSNEPENFTLTGSPVLLPEQQALLYSDRQLGRESPAFELVGDEQPGAFIMTPIGLQAEAPTTGAANLSGEATAPISAAQKVGESEGVPAPLENEGRIHSGGVVPNALNAEEFSCPLPPALVECSGKDVRTEEAPQHSMVSSSERPQESSSRTVPDSGDQHRSDVCASAPPSKAVTDPYLSAAADPPPSQQPYSVQATENATQFQDGGRLNIKLSEPSRFESLFAVTLSQTGDLNEETFFPEERSDCVEGHSADVNAVFPVLRHDQDMANVVLQKFLTDRLNAQNDGLFLLRFPSFEAAAVAIRKCRGTVLFDRRALLIFSPRRCISVDGQLVDLPLR
ncbi:hypothetical protein TGME49_259600 [Toxoplasma gondii ME49]|uniref:RNA recognition motif-containing protein n=4 Tax=Toxoplasma gondii TaxID=5811 RepID=A0A125YV64_TOXGV|nr:hypothetical protein TGME49_259600 [Toxoplasma gondii ME49]EPT29442.1 hypothetical protein TGME49_259600 [Toxoplasma gondii ME49]ESS32139.1 hypothetical protein TGVEG_259600 [Toxoplasma gondii VEG]KYF41614.1 hypothetical protein TGARI_259600 [Toxoplasma gondii ARI]|eukprot:XP_002365154.2 hypothetical protein TGME49_259600 [Toxoplasma gondii ME49]